MRDLEIQGRIDAKIARNAEAAAEAQQAYAAARRELAAVIGGRAYSFPGPLADLDVYKAVVKMAAARARQGIASVNQFILELNQMRIDAKLAKLSDEELALAKKAYLEGVESSKVGTYTTKIKWGPHTVDARPYGPGYWGKRIRQDEPLIEAYELKINPNNESFYLPHPDGGYVQFENIVGNTVQDGKLIDSPRSIYHVKDMPPFAGQKAMAQAKRQLAAAEKGQA